MTVQNGHTSNGDAQLNPEEVESGPAESGPKVSEQEEQKEKAPQAKVVENPQAELDREVAALMKAQKYHNSLVFKLNILKFVLYMFVSVGMVVLST